GLRIYRNGEADSTEVIRDGLTRDISHRKEWGDYDVGSIKLQLAARFRDIGFGGGAIDDFRLFDRELTPVEVKADFVSSGGVLRGGADGDEAAFADYVLRIDPECAEARKAWHEASVAENKVVSDVKQIMVMQDMPGQRPAYVLFRGQYDQRRDEVGPDVPASVLPFSPEWPRNRLGLAKWLTDQRNPLVARVTVNRFWTIFFGKGLVGTPEDFGSQGERPSHPELLNWMAGEFIDSGWNVKALLKKIALSATYRQDSIPSDPALWAEDPDNRLLARGPRHRLSAEQVRDNVLAVSGLLVPEIGGPPVNPYELASSFKPMTPGSGPALYRRSLYTFWKRTAPPPVMVTFDATAREVCTIKRDNTTTPLQALVLLNGPQYVEAARVLAERLLGEAEKGDRERIEMGFRLCTGRSLELSEATVLDQMLAEQLAYYREKPKEAADLLRVGAKAAGTQFEPARLAAWTVLCQGLMNFDETYTKR
ncbi:MAG: DUF1553 domain-containing protein, partial [Verrucomicrobiae bacterium]|nr:DUF1553 domain-containing protein [Verrucomicrobiae bacterium]